MGCGELPTERQSRLPWVVRMGDVTGAPTSTANTRTKRNTSVRLNTRNTPDRQHCLRTLTVLLQGYDNAARRHGVPGAALAKGGALLAWFARLQHIYRRIHSIKILLLRYYY